MILNKFTLYIPYNNFNNQDYIDLFITNNLFDFSIDYHHNYVSAISKIDYNEKILIKFNSNFIPDNKTSSCNISRDENNLILDFKKF
jgi:hypothetical protein